MAEMMRRVVVLGTSGSGKTTFARELAERLGLPHVELDALHWGPNWSGAPKALLRERVTAATSEDGWIIDGNYSPVRDAIWPKADTLIWLDYPMTTVFTRVLRRTLRRWWTREQLWNGNRERLWDQFLSRDSLFLWVISTWRIHRRDYPKLLRLQSRSGKRVVRFRHPEEMELWISNLVRLETARPDCSSD
jgi:adenylate kinase family enzyme